jgi:hypothetical protein
MSRDNARKGRVQDLSSNSPNFNALISRAVQRSTSRPGLSALKAEPSRRARYRRTTTFISPDMWRFGGITDYHAILGTHIDEFCPAEKQNRRCIVPSSTFE